jgi:hypothetical protein
MAGVAASRDKSQCYYDLRFLYISEVVVSPLDKIGLIRLCYRHTRLIKPWNQD